MSLIRRNALHILIGSVIAVIGGEAVATTGPTLKCTLVGQKIVFRGYSYRCIKSRGKLIWKKGAPVPMATPSPTATAPSPTATATATPSPTATATATHSPTATATHSPTATATATPSPTAASKGVVIANSSQISEGAVRIIEAKDNNGNVQSFAISRFGGKITVLSTVCTHQGCLVQAASSDLVCPCHDSKFSGFDGAVQRGPAVRGLAVFRSLEEDGEIILIK